MLGELDCDTLLLLFGLFIVIAGIHAAGVIDAAARLFHAVAGESPFRLFTLLVVVSVVLSAFIDNIPYVAAMLPVVQSIAALMNDGVGVEPYVFYFGLLTGATLGGNLTPIGASANIAAIGILRKKRRDRHHLRLPAHRRALYAGRRAGRLCVPVAGVGQSLIFWPPERLPAEEKNKETPTLCTAGKSACRGLFSRKYDAL